MKTFILNLQTMIFFFLVLGISVEPPDQALAQNKKILPLTLGLTHEEKVPNMPQNLGDDLNYNRNVVRISIARELKLIRFEPIAAGQTNFVLRDDKGKKIVEYVVTVRKNNLGTVAAEIQKKLGDIEGITIGILNNRVVVDGEVLLPRDVNRIASVLAQYGPEVASSLVTLSPLAQKKIAELIERDIGNPEIHVRSVNEKFILEGVASSDAEKTKAVIIAKTYVPDVVVEYAEGTGQIKKRKTDSVIDLLSVKPAPEPQPGKMIKIVVHFVELQKDFLKGFKFQFAPTLKDTSGADFSSGNGTTAGGIVGQLTGTVSNLLPKLNTAKEHGHARILQSSTIIVQDGNPGIIKSVTNIPYSAQNQYGQLTTNFAQTGLDTNITPAIISPRSDSISLTVTFTVKALVGQDAKGPQISEKTIQTKVIVRNTQSAAVGGLVTSDQSTGYNRVPAGAQGQDPIVNLLASKQFQKNQSQFVVFITPYILTSASEGSEEVKRKFRMHE